MSGRKPFRRKQFARMTRPDGRRFRLRRVIRSRRIALPIQARGDAGSVDCLPGRQPRAAPHHRTVAGFLISGALMIALHQPQPKPEIAPRSLLDICRDFLAFNDAKIVDIPYEARQELKRRHMADMREAVNRGGFTLVEMLVAVGLVVLMMSLFATVFTMATKAMSTQKGIAENDQKTRLAQTILRSDLNYRTASVVQPFEIGEVPANITDRDGYFYIGENDRDDDTDDVLAFTVRVSNATDLFYGRAFNLNGGTLALSPNQPEFDDGIAGPNSAGSSHSAEVVYFLRAGILYRRVLLIREPIKPSGAVDGTPIDGADGASGGAIPMTRFLAGGDLNFYSELDYSSAQTLLGPKFHGIQDLPNDISGSTFGLGKPNYRFGFNHLTGMPREFIGTNFIGRFTHWETSYQPGSYSAMAGNSITSFGYPWRDDSSLAPNPMSEPTLTYDASLGLVTSYTLVDGNQRPVPGRRASEDILLTNVQRFDIKVWDEAAAPGPNGIYENGADGTDDGEFVDVGHNGANGFYNANSGVAFHKTPTGYLGEHPADSTRRLWRFDTWNPQVDMNSDGSFDPPPFHAPGVAPHRPMKAIQIRITFFDPTSQQLRDVTLVQSLTKSDMP